MDNLVILFYLIPLYKFDKTPAFNLSNNLHSLLRNNGNVLCSRFHEFPEKVEEEERRIFEENFEFHDYGKNAGYCYIKK